MNLIHSRFFVICDGGVEKISILFETFTPYKWYMLPKNT